VEVKGSLPRHGAPADAGRRFTVHGSVAGTNHCDEPIFHSPHLGPRGCIDP
jgi:hypothetical protein